MRKSDIQPSSAHPTTGYTHGVLTHSGLLFIAGQVAKNPSDTTVGPGDMAAQAVQVFENIGAGCEESIRTPPSDRATWRPRRSRSSRISALMAMGQQKDRQGDLMVSWSEMPRSPGHVFYDRLQLVLIEGGFDGFAEAVCQPYYAARMGAPSVPPGRYFRMHLVGYFEGIDSERGLEWRCSDSLSLREFLLLEMRERVPDHSWLSRTRARLPHEVHTCLPRRAAGSRTWSRSTST